MGPWVFLDHFGPLRVAAGDEGVGPHAHAGIAVEVAARHEAAAYVIDGEIAFRTWRMDALAGEA